MQQGDFINVPQLNSLQPRQPTTGNVDLLLPLQPKLLVPLVERRDSNRLPMPPIVGGIGATATMMASTATSTATLMTTTTGNGIGCGSSSNGTGCGAVNCTGGSGGSVAPVATTNVGTAGAGLLAGEIPLEPKVTLHNDSCSQSSNDIDEVDSMDGEEV
ncbi:uncharacterized protein LOC129760629 [Uranotaenia lowii]|uniref:uncharacterized protein LOC129760629 n=1 Tax=Uranotaenia lowii TaxID=190385 RepID=UPI00247A56B7|nr:uncharacterized protein LOC129760629 [Uranotaenia lowii]